MVPQRMVFLFLFNLQILVSFVSTTLFLIEKNIKQIIIKEHIHRNIVQDDNRLFPVLTLNHPLTQLGAGSGENKH